MKDTISNELDFGSSNSWVIILFFCTVFIIAPTGMGWSLPLIKCFNLKGAQNYCHWKKKYMNKLKRESEIVFPPRFLNFFIKSIEMSILKCSSFWELLVSIPSTETWSLSIQRQNLGMRYSECIPLPFSLKIFVTFSQYKLLIIHVTNHAVIHGGVTL